MSTCFFGWLLTVHYTADIHPFHVAQSRMSLQDSTGAELGGDITGDSYSPGNDTPPNVTQRPGKRRASTSGVSSGDGTKSSKSARCWEEQYKECVSNISRLAALKIQKEEQRRLDSENQAKYGPVQAVEALNELGDSVSREQRYKVLEYFVKSYEFRHIFIILPPEDRLGLIQRL